MLSFEAEAIVKYQNELKWDYRFMDIAQQVSTWSKDPSTKVGAVLVRDRRILATGYNGFPRGIADDERLHDREKKYQLIVHAEMNVLMNAVEGGISTKGADLYVYGLPPCTECTKNMLQTGLATIIMYNPKKCGRPDWIQIWETKSWPMFFNDYAPALRFLEPR